MGKRVFDRDEQSGTTEYFYYDDRADTFTIETEQVVEDLVESNKRSFNDSSQTWQGDMHRVASIPMNLYWDLKQRGILDDQEKFRKWLNSPENRYFRTRPGRV